MTKTMRLYEVFRFGGGGIPGGLAERLVVPRHINKQGHPLLPYVAKQIIPTDLDFILLEDLNGFYQDLIKNPLGFFSDCRGLYLAQDHPYISKEDYAIVNAALKKNYGIEVKRALLLPLERVDYWTLIHESLHDVFSQLPADLRNKIVQSAIVSYGVRDKLRGMLNLTHLNLSNFCWDLDEISRRMSDNERKGVSFMHGFDDFYIFGNLKPADQFQVVDEFISNFFANDRNVDRWDCVCLPFSFRQVLKETGYNMQNPPKINMGF